MLYLRFTLKVMQSFIMFISYSYIIGILFYIVSLQGHWILESRSIDVDPATWVNDYELYPLND